MEQRYPKVQRGKYLVAGRPSLPTKSQNLTIHTLMIMTLSILILEGSANKGSVYRTLGQWKNKENLNRQGLEIWWIFGWN